MSDLAQVYAQLHAIMAPFAAKLDVKRDDGGELYVDTRHLQKNKTPLFFGAVQARKSHVSYHLMPVYMNPRLLDTVSPELKARMQGKSCFNFKSSDPALFKELQALTKAAFSNFKEQGFV